jgi:hypothetical protein
MYQNGPLTKADMLDRINTGKKIDSKFAKNFQIKRAGRDKDDTFYQIGKLHGLENIMFLDEDELKACKGDPWKVQILLNKANDTGKPLPPQSFDKLIEKIAIACDDYKYVIDGSKNDFFSSDRKKLLSLPF